jgi:hypothetical protein
VIVYEPDPKHCPVAVAVTVGIGSVAMVIGNIKVQLLASMMCKPSCTCCWFKLATLLVPYAPGVIINNK